MLAACTTADRIAPVTEPTLPVAASANSRSNADELMTYLARLRTMNEASLAAEAARHKRETADLGRVKAAMALSLSAQAEDADILALLDPVVKKDGGDRDVKAMASFLHAMVMERRRLKESAAAAGAKLRDERRTAEAQKQRAETLQQKLDALTELEKSLSDRDAQSR
jgi:hypothetical protein